MITVIPMLKEGQDETEAVSLLPRLFHTQGRPTTEDLWIFVLSKGIEEGQQCAMETSESRPLAQ